MNTRPVGDVNLKQVRTAQSTVLSQSNEATLIPASTMHSTVYVELNSSPGNPFDQKDSGMYATHAQFALDREKITTFLEACATSGRDPKELLKAAVERCCEEVLRA